MRLRNLLRLVVLAPPALALLEWVRNEFLGRGPARPELSDRAAETAPPGAQVPGDQPEPTPTPVLAEPIEYVQPVPDDTPPTQPADAAQAELVEPDEVVAAEAELDVAAPAKAELDVAAPAKAELDVAAPAEAELSDLAESMERAAPEAAAPVAPLDARTADLVEQQEQVPAPTPAWDQADVQAIIPQLSKKARRLAEALAAAPLPMPASRLAAEFGVNRDAIGGYAAALNRTAASTRPHLPPPVEESGTSAKPRYALDTAFAEHWPRDSS